MTPFFNLIQWMATNYQRPMQLLVVLLTMFPFVVIGILFALLMGIVPSPLLSYLEQSGKDHKDFSLHNEVLTNSMIQLNGVAGEYYTLLKAHSRDSKRKEHLIEFLVLEGCRRDNKLNKDQCERLEKTLNRLEP